MILKLLFFLVFAYACQNTQQLKDEKTLLDQIKAGNKGKVEQMIEEKKVDVNCLDRDLKTPLHHAAILKKQDIFSLLLSKGANPEAKDKYGYTPKEYLKTVKKFEK